jgi:hypothetical protein
VRALRLFLAAVVLFACGDDDAATSEVAFRGEIPALPGFSFDTGPRPPSGPAQVSLKLSSAGAIRVGAAATSDGATLVGKPGSGSLALDLHVKLEGQLKVDTPVQKYDGDLPGLRDIDIPIAGESTFDPFLIGGPEARVEAAVPETKLPPIPLGSVPGKLVLTITSASRVATAFRGACMRVRNRSATYTGATTTDGSLVLRGAIELELPAPFKQTVDIGEIAVPIPPLTKAIELGPVEADASDSAQGACDVPIVETPDGGTEGGKVEPATVAIGGTKATVTSIAVEDALGFRSVVLGVEGPVPRGSSVKIGVYRVEAGCSDPAGTDPQNVLLQIGSERYRAGIGPMCGLTVGAIARAVGDRATGSFHGIVSHEGATDTLQLDVTFDFVR